MGVKIQLYITQIYLSWTSVSISVNFCLSQWASGLVLGPVRKHFFTVSSVPGKQTALPGSLCHKSKVARMLTVWNMDLLVFPVSKFQHFSAEELCKLKHTYVLSEKISMTSVNSMWSSDAIWWHRSGSTLAQVMALCCQAQSHYLKQCWLCISDILWHSPKNNFTVIAQAIILYDAFENYTINSLPHLPGANELRQQLEMKSDTVGCN